MSDLKALKAATGGTWFLHDFADPAVSSDPSPSDVTISCDHPATITVAYMGNAMTARLDEARANAAFLVALVNAYRAGRLVEVAADEAHRVEAVMRVEGFALTL